MSVQLFVRQHAINIRTRTKLIFLSPESPRVPRTPSPSRTSSKTVNFFQCKQNHRFFGTQQCPTAARNGKEPRTYTSPSTYLIIRSSLYRCSTERFESSATTRILDIRTERKNKKEKQRSRTRRESYPFGHTHVANTSSHSRGQ